jgi:hypothetical protein
MTKVKDHALLTGRYLTEDIDGNPYASYIDIDGQIIYRWFVQK